MDTLWPFALSVGTAAVMAGASIVPAVRKAAFGEVKQDWLCNELDLDSIESDRCTVITKTGTACRVIALIGLPYDTTPMEEQVNLLLGRRQLLDQIAGLGVSWRLFGVKRCRPLVHVSTWPSPVLQEIGEAEERVYRSSYAIHWYLMISHSDARGLETATQRALGFLKPYKAVLLESPKEPGKACPLTNFLNYLLCGELRSDLTALSSNLSASLPAADGQFERSGLVTFNVPLPVYHRVIVVRRWPETVSGQILGDVMMLDGEIDITQVCLPAKKEVAAAMFARKANEHRHNPFASPVALVETEEARSMISDGHGWLKTQLYIVARAHDPKALDDLVQQVTDLLAHHRVLHSVETVGAAVAWFNRQPDHDRLLRPLSMTAEAVAALWPLPFSPVGRANSPWGSGPIRLFPSMTGQAYSFQFHLNQKEQALGHYLVFAPSGSGKSTLIMHLLGGQSKHLGVPAYVCDSKQGTRFMVEAMGGVYQSYDTLALNPLAVAENTKADRQRLTLLIKAMLGTAAAAPETDEIIAHLLDTAFKFDPHERSFSAFFGACFPRNTPQRAAMARWITDDKGREGDFSHIFNSPNDSLSNLLSSAPIVGINMNEALADPVLGPPVVSHIVDSITRARERGEGRRGFNIFIDEAANLLRNEAFREQVAVMYREFRKLDGVVGMAFQDPGALHASGIAEAVLENVATLIFFPNVMGKPAAYEVFNLNDEQKDFIFNNPPDSGRRVLVVRRDSANGFEESVILNVDLSPLGADCLKYYRSGASPIAEMERLQMIWGDEWTKQL